MSLNQYLTCLQKIYKLSYQNSIRDGHIFKNYQWSAMYTVDKFFI